MDQQKSWYAIYTKSRCEKKVLSDLAAIGVEAYLPLRVVERQWSDRKKKVEMPIINSYVFVKLPPDNLECVYNIAGFVAYVRNGRNAAVISEREITVMRKAVDSEFEISIEHSLIEKGQKIKIISGALQGTEGIVSDINKRKINIVIASLGFTLVVDLKNDESIIEVLGN